MNILGKLNSEDCCHSHKPIEGEMILASVKNITIWRLQEISGSSADVATRSVGVALNVRFTTNRMCAKNNTHIYAAQQARIE